MLDGAEETQEFGPFLAGFYTVKGVTKAGEKTNEDAVTVKLLGTKTKSRRLHCIPK